MMYVVYNMNHIHHSLNEPKKSILRIFKNIGSMNLVLHSSKALVELEFKTSTSMSMLIRPNS